MLVFREEEALEIGQELATKLRLEMRLLGAKQDGEQLVFLYTAPKRINFKPFVENLHQILQIPVVLQPIEPREKAKLTGGIGRCGRAICCKQWLRCPVETENSAAGSGNTPEKYCGLCGKSMCCLAYDQGGWCPKKELAETAVPQTAPLAESGTAVESGVEDTGSKSGETPEQKKPMPRGRRVRRLKM